MDEQLRNSLQRQLHTMSLAVKELGGAVVAPSDSDADIKRIRLLVIEAEKTERELRAATEAEATVSYETLKLMARWNDALFGILYAGALIGENGGLTDRQSAILNSAIEEIAVFAEKESLSLMA